MENSLVKSGSTERSKKIRSFDIRSVDKIEFSRNENKNGKRKREKEKVSVDGDYGLEKKKKKKRKSGKEAFLSSFDLDDKVNGNSDALVSTSHLAGKLGVLLGLDSSGNGVKVPKRPRDFVRRRKSEKSHVSSGTSGEQVSKMEGSSVGKSNSIDKRARSNGGGKSRVISAKRNSKIGVDGGKKISSKKIYAQVPVVEEQVHSIVNNNGDGPSSKKKSSNCRKKKGSDGLLVKVEPRVDNSVMMDDSPDDDEDNLEENAAMMLSSRFDPSCTQFPPKSRSPSTNGLSSLVTSDDNFVSRGISMSASSELSSGDVANRVVRPNKKHKRDGFSKKKRQFYEVSFRDVDAFWLLNKRIKVYWPLDESWYYGSVCDYSRETKQHHIKYDDRDEEWIDLRNEKFELLLLPSEVPQETEPEGDSFGNKNEDVEDKNSPSDDSLETSYLDSEPISSWLVLSSRKVKSSHLGFSKRHKTSYLSSKVSKKLTSKVATGTEHIKNNHPLELEKNKLNCNLALPDSFNDFSSMGEKAGLEGRNIELGGNSPVVYVRRRFKKKANGPIETDGKACGGTPVPTRGNGTPTESERLLGLVDNVGLIKLPVPFVEYKKLKIVPGFPFSSLKYIFGEDSWLVQALFLLNYGTITNTWPKIHLEILFVDSVLGLRFLSFEGSLKQAVEFVILIMSVFYIPDRKEKSIDMPMPVTSISFMLSCSEGSKKRHAFSLYSFFQVKCSKWLSLNSKMQPHCLLAKEMPLIECTYDNLKTMETGKQLPLGSKRQASVGNEGLWRECLHDVIPKNDVVNLSFKDTNSPAKDNVKHEKLLSLTRLFSAAPSLGLHLQFIMETNVPSVSVDENNPESSKDSEPALVAETASECNGPDHHNKIVQSLEVECVNTQTKLVTRPSRFLVPKDKHCALSVEVPSLQPDEKPDMALNLSNKFLLNPKVTGPLWLSGGSSLESSHLRPGRNPDFIHNGFSTGPKKRRTQVQYTLPSSGNNSSSKHNSHIHRIRKAQNTYRDKGLLACDGNVLVTIGDKGWREYGARVELESADHNVWKLAVKFSGYTKYSYKASQFLQPGSTNRYTLAMIWRGGKDWALEFPDRNQWVLFKEMYEECFNRNLRAASVKHIPIPGVRLIEECDAIVNDLPFIRNSSGYIRQVETDAEMAMNPSRVLYDMDSEDEMWVECKDVSEEFFEKAMDMLEKVAFAQQRDDFCIEEIEEFTPDIGPMETIKTIYEHWRSKRQRKGMPLIRHLQAPLWESYQLRVKKWEQAVATTSTSLSSGSNDRTPPPEKPPMFAFCLKPRGLEIPNKGTKQRSHRRYPASSNSNYSLLGDHDGPYASGRRSNGYTYYGDEKVMYAGNSYECSDTSPSFKPSTRVFSPRDAGGYGQFSSGNDSYEWNNHNPNFLRNKSKNVGFLRSANNADMRGPYNHSTLGRRSLPKWPSQRHNKSPLPLRYGFEQLDGSDFYEFQLRDAAGAAKHALNMARLKREKANRLLYKANLATHKAAVALMTAEVIKASFEDLNGEDDDSDDDESTEYDSYGDGSDDDDSDDSECTR